ncbi:MULTISPECIES: LysR family transcriptional regulator [unclassified Streptomyces]|uniref:LysR family transcriptional regulator n=1 Tax=unclassified Streptomyces TaxID=2593676 RepID=UPI00136A6C1E|nr:MULTISPECIES: LysR family transcriptional regulator [unclassified Streptomyces]NDZ97735.1 LysR family transcriptional regulator [Streptomyces sp. SID10116]MYY87147.1 LysR family transcriptional regulator [Streptomyces sp. SID335]MYZ15915.1 LysR family transcriptional regulator [Streptomyces sp. SID337]NDZ90916.1 LysR family transcriptional regulator [Streptomyces sp. SID10115]NEB46590.1 LysR family transcriptional regulator [Streptomyces sp. SID339]
MLDVRRLHMLKTVAARGSISAAAQSLELSAGAVSQQLAALRQDVGVDLLRPDGRTVALTEAGRVLLEHADRVFAAVEEAECAVAAVKGTVGATATLAALPSTVARIVAPALTALGADHPQLAVTCLVTDQAQLRELTLGAVDVVLGQRYHHLPETTPKGIAVSPLLDDPLLVVTAEHGGDERPVALRDLATHHLVVPPPATDCGQAVLHACRQAGFTPTARYVTADIAAQLELARAGLATALVPRAAIDPAAPGIRTAPIGDHPVQRLLFAATRRMGTANPTTAAVVAALRTAARQDRTTRLPPT